MHSIGKTIRTLRQERDWNQEEVATKLKISIPAYSKMETGITDINLSRLEQIAQLYDKTLTELLSFGNDEPVIDYEGQLKDLNFRLHSREAEMITLQTKLIQLFEELKKVPAQGKLNNAG